MPSNDRKIETRVIFHLGGLLIKAGLADLDPLRRSACFKADPG
ncbi:conjugal transfer protein TraD [Skermanella aerolata]